VSLFFADTFYWIALTNPKDSAHKKVLQFTAKLAARSVITTDEVLTEFLAFCASDQRLRREAGLAVDRLIQDPDLHIVPQSRSTFLARLKLYNARPDKGYSLTDCISMKMMRRESILHRPTKIPHRRTHRLILIHQPHQLQS